MQTRNSMEIALFAAMAGSTAQAVFGTLPPSLARSPILGHLSAVGITTGSLIALLGIIWWRSRDTGLIIEQFGAGIAGFGCLFYASALVVSPVSFSDVSIVLGMSSGIAVACGFRYFQIQRYIHNRKNAERGQR